MITETPRGTEPNQPPTVFVSYSHDDKDHKAWVAQLGTRLREKGVEVVLDQWDTELGDALDKFMERGVRDSDRVLMICTEKYVRRVNDGKGGAGYEAMIVTAELIKDQGINKFIPIIRQAQGDRMVPHCLSTRKYVDLSEGQDFEAGLLELLETIHKVIGAKKPPLGLSPFRTQELTDEKKQENAALAQTFSAETSTPRAAYETARAVIASRDFGSWRKLIQSVERACRERLIQWRRSSQANLPRIVDRKNPATLWDTVAEATQCYDPLLGCLLAAAESGDSEFSSQLGWIDLVAEPAGWERSGVTMWAELPHTVLLYLHSAVGAMLMQNRAGEQAVGMATTSIRNPMDVRLAAPLYLSGSVTGWQETFGTYCAVSWGFLVRTFEKSEWLQERFGSSEELRVSLRGYYMLLGVLEFVRECTRERWEVDPKNIRFEVPHLFCVGSESELRAAYGLMLGVAPVIRRLLEANNVSQQRFQELWPQWMEAVIAWIGRVKEDPFGFRGRLPQAEFANDLFRDPFKLAL